MANFPAYIPGRATASSVGNYGGGGLWHRFRPCLSVLGVTACSIPGNDGSSKELEIGSCFRRDHRRSDGTGPSLATAKEPGRLSLSFPLPRRQRRILSPCRAVAKSGGARGVGVFFVLKKMLY